MAVWTSLLRKGEGEDAEGEKGKQRKGLLSYHTSHTLSGAHSKYLKPTHTLSNGVCKVLLFPDLSLVLNRSIPSGLELVPYTTSESM